MRLRLLTVLAGTLVVAPLVAQDRPGENAAAARIAEGVEKVRAGQLLDAVEQFQRVLDTAGDDLVPVNRYHFAPARWVVHGHIARLPAEGVKLYRQRIDGQAAKRFEESQKSRSEAGLNRLLAEMFASRASEEAILELARRAFERGEFDAAEHFWRMLLPGDDNFLRYPNPKTPPSAVLARLVLVKLFQGERPDAVDGLTFLKEKYANETGLLAGKTGKYVETLADLIARPADTTLPRPQDEPDWPTFAGSAARTGSTRSRLPYFWPDVPMWRASLPLLRHKLPDGPAADPLHPRALAFFPIVVGGKVYVADGARLFAIDLMTGQSTTAAWLNKDGEDTVVPALHDVRHTLTEANGIIYVRMGSAALKPGPPGVSVIAAFGKTGRGEERECLWRLGPPAAEGAATHFEGTPAVRGDKLFAAYWQQAGAEAVAGVACYRMDDLRTPPDLVWQRKVGKAGAEPNNEVRYRHEMVTLSGPNVVFNTDGGTVIALDAETGRPAWEYRYPRDERPTLPRCRDLCPPLADGGRIYAAPADTDRLLCLDAFTGQLIWERESVEIVHLLGVAKGRLIATLGGQIKGIRGFNVRTGADSGGGGWTVHDDGGEFTFGRGLVSDEVVVWPTRHGLHFVNPTDGTRLREPIPGAFGNLCFADGCLLVTTATEIRGFLSEAKKRGVRRKAVDAAPNDPAKLAALAQSLIDAGDFDGAEWAVAKAGSEADRLRWFLADRLIREGEKDRALSLYKTLADGKSVYSAAALVRRAEQCDDKPEAREAWRAAFANGGSVRDEQGVPWPAAAYSQAHYGQAPDIRGTTAAKEMACGCDSPKPLPPITLARDGFHPLEDASLRTLGMRNGQIVSVGERLHLAPGGEAFQLDWRPTCAAVDGKGGVWCGGADRIVGYRVKDTRLVPHTEIRLDAPTLTRLDRPGLPVASGRDSGSLTAIEFDNASLSFRFGGQVLANLKLFEGDTSLILRPSSTTATFQPNYSRGSGYLLTQLSNGRMLVRGPTDKSAREYPAARQPWREPPAHVGGDRFLIPDENALILFDAQSGQVLARYPRSNSEAVTSEPLRARIHQDHVLLISRLNHGVEIDRLTVGDLKRSWRRTPVFVGRELNDVAFAGDRVFVVADGDLSAYVWATGERLWDALLPDTTGIGWKVSVAPTGLIAYPAEALRTGSGPDLTSAIGQGGWLGPGVLQYSRKSYHLWATRELPVLVLDPADGRLVQRLTFPAAGPAAGVALTPTGVCVVTGAGNWTLSAR